MLLPSKVTGYKEKDNKQKYDINHWRHVGTSGESILLWYTHRNILMKRRPYPILSFLLVTMSLYKQFASNSSNHWTKSISSWAKNLRFWRPFSSSRRISVRLRLVAPIWSERWWTRSIGIKSMRQLNTDPALAYLQKLSWKRFILRQISLRLNSPKRWWKQPVSDARMQKYFRTASQTSKKSATSNHWNLLTR